MSYYYLEGKLLPMSTKARSRNPRNNGDWFNTFFMIPSAGGRTWPRVMAAFGKAEYPSHHELERWHKNYVLHVTLFTTQGEHGIMHPLMVVTAMFFIDADTVFN